MLVAIFRAEIGEVDDDYFKTAKSLRALALKDYSCIEFVSACENNVEIALSYWPDESYIAHWQQDPLHLAAQKKGKTQWYRSYSVQIAEIKNQK